MKSFATVTAGLVATTLPGLAFANSIPDIFKTRQAPPPSCNEGSVLCPGCDGRNLTDGQGEKWAISCGYEIEAEDESKVGGVVSTSICLDACDDDNDCFGVTFAPNGSCVIAGGKLKGLSYSPGYTNFARLAALTSTSTSHAGVTATTGSGVTRITSSTSATPTYSGTSSQCSLDDEDLCPRCSGSVVTDSSGNSYRVLCDTSLESNGSYSPQDWLSPEECLHECDQHDFCTGVTYFSERSCELAKADPETTYDESFTAFLPLKTPTTSPTVRLPTSRSQAWNSSLTAPIAGPPASILPINSGCNASAVTCNECDGFQITDKLNGSYTTICGREPMCVTTDQRGQGTQEECLQKCDQDVTCLGAMWSPDSLFCNLCLRGMELSRVAGALPYVLFAADIDGDEESTTTSAKPTLTITLPTTVSAVQARSITDLPAPFPTEPVLSNIASTLANRTSTRTSTIISTSDTPFSSFSPAPTSSAAPSTTPVVCPDSDNHVYLGSSPRDTFAIGCGARFEAAHSSFFSAPNFEACASMCTASCDGVQFGYTSRCGIYTDITFIGPAQSWTVAARITIPGSTGLPATVTSADVSAIVSATSRPSSVPSSTTGTFVYASPVTSAFVTSRRSNFTAPLQSPSITRSNTDSYSLA